MPDVRAEISGYSRKTEEILLSLLREQEDLKGKWKQLKNYQIFKIGAPLKQKKPYKLGER